MMRRMIARWLAILVSLCIGTCSRSGFDSVAALPVGDDLGTDSGSGGTVFQSTLVVSGDENDGEIFLQSFWPQGEVTTNMRLWTGQWNTSPVWIYLRFVLPRTISSSAIFSSTSRVRLWGRGAQHWGDPDHALTVAVETSADAPVVQVAIDAPDHPTGRALVATTTRWPSDGSSLLWRDGEWNESPSLALALQELLAQAGPLGAGSHVQIWITRASVFTGAHPDGEVFTDDFSNGDSHAAQLILDYVD